MRDQKEFDEKIKAFKVAHAEASKKIDAYIAGLNAQLQAQGDAEIAQAKKWADQQWVNLAQQTEYINLIEKPANELVRFMWIPGMWEMIPEDARQEKIKQTADLREKAEAGDKTAQAVLLRGQTIFKEKGGKLTEGLPSLSWQEPVKNK